jgi:integrase
MKLTQAIVDNAAFDPSQPILWDDQIPGFGVRTFKTGKKSYVLRYRIGHTKRYYTLAGCHLINLREARQEARQVLYQVSQGEDPSVKRQKVKSLPTFEELTERYRSDRLPLKRTVVSLNRRIKATFPKRWANRRAIDITRQDVHKLHLDLGKRGHYTANRTLELLRAMYEFGREIQMIPEDHSNPAKGITPFKEQSRERFVSEAEAKRLLRALADDECLYTRVYFTVLLMTGLRAGELLRVKWEDIDRDTARLRLPQTKSGMVQWIPLASQALAQIDSLPRTSSPYLFPGRRNPKTPRVTFQNSWLRVCQAAGLTPGRKGITVHDLRRSFGSWLSQSGVDLNTIRQLLRHSKIETTMIYARLGQDAGRDDVEAQAARLGALASTPSASPD